MAAIKTKSSIAATLASREEEQRILENLESLSRQICEHKEDAVLIEEMNKLATRGIGEKNKMVGSGTKEAHHAAERASDDETPIK